MTRRWSCGSKRSRLNACTTATDGRTCVSDESFKDNDKRIYHLYREHALALRHMRPKRSKDSQLRQPNTLALWVNQIWSMNFVADNLFDWRKLRVLTMVD